MFDEDIAEDGIGYSSGLLRLRPRRRENFASRPPGDAAGPAATRASRTHSVDLVLMSVIGSLHIETGA
jgi:hypothetical protein